MYADNVKKTILIRMLQCIQVKQPNINATSWLTLFTIFGFGQTQAEILNSTTCLPRI